MPPERIGIYGGSFNPVHNGHLRVADLALRRGGCSRVVFVPVAAPPHKPGGGLASTEDRLAMLHAAVAGRPDLEVSRSEIDRGGVSYTIDTLREFRARLGPGGPKLTLILGADMLAILPQWREVDEVVSLAALFVVGREGSSMEVPAPILARFGAPFADRLRGALVLSAGPESSSEIRRRCAAGESIDDWAPPAVARYIRERKLYAK